MSAACLVPRHYLKQRLSVRSGTTNFNLCLERQGLAMMKVQTPVLFSRTSSDVRFRQGFAYSTAKPCVATSSLIYHWSESSAYSPLYRLGKYALLSTRTVQGQICWGIDFLWQKPRNTQAMIINMRALVAAVYLVSDDILEPIYMNRLRSDVVYHGRGECVHFAFNKRVTVLVVI